MWVQHLSFWDQIIFGIKSLEIWTSEMLRAYLACTEWANEAKQEGLGGCTGNLLLFSQGDRAGSGMLQLLPQYP